MKKLVEMVRLLDRRRLKKIEIFNDSGGKSAGDNLYYKFYHGIREGAFSTDEEAAQMLCDTIPSDKKYLMLKSRFKTRLLNTLFFLEKSASRYQQALYDSNRDLFSARILFLNGARDSAVALLRSTLSEAEKFSITDVAMEASRMLRQHSAYVGHQADYETYDSKFEEYRILMEAEYFSEKAIQDVVVHFAKSASQVPGMSAHARRGLERIEEMLGGRGMTHNLKLNTLRLRLMIHQMEGNHRATLGVAQEAENYLLRRPLLSQNVRLGEFALNQMVACMHLGDYKAGEDNAKRCLVYLTEGSNNWMTFLEYFFLLCMHTGNYNRAEEVFRQVTSHPRFGSLDETRAEKWRIFGAFLHYMHRDESDAGEQRRFSFNKFLNEVPIYSRDKRGRNISILILQILHLLDKKDWSAIIGRTESLKVYASRHLKKDETFRSNCFVKMMLTMEKKDFDRSETSRIAAKYLTKLQGSRFDYRGDLSNLEVIPYEMLWEKVLTRLKAAA